MKCLSKWFKKVGWLILALAISLFALTACSAEDVEDALDIAIEVLDTLSDGKQEYPLVEEDGWYSTKDEVALYIHLYGELPDNYITKNEARDLGWESSEGNLWEVAEGMSIGGDRYYNNDEQLPEVTGRKYYECDINYSGGFRGAERIVYSNDGLIYYTGDHYESFECLYGEE